jgi:hypothetical protein
MKLKLQFFDWFEAMVKQILVRHDKRLQKKSTLPIEEDRDLLENGGAAQSHDLISFMGGVHDPPSQVDT